MSKSLQKSTDTNKQVHNFLFDNENPVVEQSVLLYLDPGEVYFQLQFFDVLKLLRESWRFS